MLKSMIYSHNGLETNARSLDVIANNLANANSVGFKRSVVFSQTLEQASRFPAQEATPLDQVDFTQGELRETGNPLSMALVGNGFFTVQSGAETYFTRQGNFTLTDDGYLATASGDLVMGEGGPILLDEDFTIQEDGAIMVQDSIVDYLSIVQVDDPNMLKRVGEGYFKASEDAFVRPTNEDVKVKAGFVESSNVNTLEEMVNMIEVYRHFEANQRALTTQDDSLDKAVNDVGRV